MVVNGTDAYRLMAASSNPTTATSSGTLTPASVTDAGIRVPDDVAVVGFDDAAISPYASVPLTTIHQPVDRIGRLAVEIVQQRIEKVDVANRTILNPTLIIRESCGASKKGAVPPEAVASVSVSQE